MWWAVAYAAAYLGSAWALSSSAFASGFTPWYPPAGLTLGFLILAGPRLWPVAVAIGVRLLNTALVFPDAWRVEPEGVVARALTITACYAVAAAALRRIGLHHARLRELGWFAGIGVVAAPLAASLCVALVEVVVLDADAGTAFEAARTFWVGDAVAIASIVPAMLLVAAAAMGLVPGPRLPRRPVESIESVLQAAALIVVPVLALAATRRKGETAYLVLAVVPVIWVSLRRNLVFAAAGLFVCTASLSIAAARFASEDVALLELQTVLLATTLAGMYIAAAIHGQEAMMADLVESEERYRSVVGSAPDLVARFDADGILLFASEPAWLAGAGGTDAVVAELRRRWSTLTRGLGVEEEVRTHEWEQTTDDGLWAYAARLSPERRADRTVRGVIAVVTDLTAQRRAEAEREESKRRDPLTGLVNRSGLLDLVAGLDADAIADQLAVVVVDIDHFKSINGVHGHDHGDEVLRCVATRVAEADPSALAAARIGGDEFALAFVVDDDGSSAAGVAERLLTELRSCLPVGGDEHYLTASLGLAVGGPAGVTAEQVFCDAETAMHAAKEGGRNRITSFDAARRSETADRRASEALLRRRLSEGSVLVHYQPAFDLRTMDLHIVEALVRLRDDHDEIVMPDRFIGIAEDSGLDVELGALVLDEVLRQLAAWQHPTLIAHVNMTARQLTRPDFAGEVLDACRRHGVAPSKVCLELTETLLMVDPEAAIASLTELRAHGVGAALDDFGTGYSSISYLSRLPVTGLKIDRSFVEGLPHDVRARAVAGLVTGLGRSLDLEVIAEGIETEDQADTLRELGCPTGQGFLLARPAPADDITGRLRASAHV